MRFLTFTDLHEDNSVLKELVLRASRPDVDFIVCCGDISAFGRRLNYNLSRFSSLGKKFYLIPGNHEDHLDLKSILSEFPNCICFNREAVEIENYVFLGYGGNGFLQQDEEFRKVAREWYGKYKERKVVFVTHGPAFGTKLDFLDKKHVGNVDYRKFVERIKPKLVINGHLHETVGAMDEVGGVKFVNPGWEGMIIEMN
ncbi:MAG: metallophosphoesterase [Nanoarchaeota archaeon]